MHSMQKLFALLVLFKDSGKVRLATDVDCLLCVSILIILRTIELMKTMNQ